MYLCVRMSLSMSIRWSCDSLFLAIGTPGLFVNGGLQDKVLHTTVCEQGYERCHVI